MPSGNGNHGTLGREEPMPDYRWPNLAAMFFDQVDHMGDRPFLWAKRDGQYKALSWGDAAAREVKQRLLRLCLDQAMLASDLGPPRVGRY